MVQTAKGQTLAQISKAMLAAIDPDEILAQAKQGKAEYVEPTEKEIQAVRESRIKAAIAPLASNPDLRNLLKKVAKAADQTIDVISRDSLIYAGPAQASVQSNGEVAKSFREQAQMTRLKQAADSTGHFSMKKRRQYRTRPTVAILFVVLIQTRQSKQR